jgi:hypothetical protein
MCFTLAAGRPDGAIVAADRRWNRQFDDGTREPSDHGGKVRRLAGQAAVAGSGDGMMLELGLAALGELDTVTLAAARAELRRVYAEHAPAIRQALPAATPERTCFVLVLPNGCGWTNHAILASGEEHLPGDPGVRMTFPPELDQAAAAGLFVRLRRAVGGRPIREWETPVRALVRELARRAPSTSPDAEILILGG